MFAALMRNNSEQMSQKRKKKVNVRQTVCKVSNAVDDQRLPRHMV